MMSTSPEILVSICVWLSVGFGEIETLKSVSDELSSCMFLRNNNPPLELPTTNEGLPSPKGLPLPSS